MLDAAAGPLQQKCTTIQTATKIQRNCSMLVPLWPSRPISLLYRQTNESGIAIRPLGVNGRLALHSLSIKHYLPPGGRSNYHPSCVAKSPVITSVGHVLPCRGNSMRVDAMRKPVTTCDINAIRSIESRNHADTAQPEAYCEILAPEYKTRGGSSVRLHGLASLDELYNEGRLEEVFVSVYSAKTGVTSLE